MTKKQAETTVAKNTIVDRLWMGAASAYFCVAAFVLNTHFVKATGYMQYVLALAPVGLAIYLLVAPLYRK